MDGRITMEELATSTKEALKTDLDPINIKLNNLVNISNEIDLMLQDEDGLKQKLVNSLNKLGFDVSMDDDISTLFDIINNIKLGQGNATPNDVLEGKTFSNDTGELLTGIIPIKSNSDININLSKMEQTLETGYYGGNINIPTSTGTAVSGNVLTGKTFMNSTGDLITGSMVNNGTKSITPKNTAQNLSSGYYQQVSISGDSDLTSSNILYGKSIFGVSGSFKGIEKIEGDGYTLVKNVSMNIDTAKKSSGEITIDYHIGSKPSRMVILVTSYAFPSGNNSAGGSYHYVIDTSFNTSSGFESGYYALTVWLTLKTSNFVFNYSRKNTNYNVKLSTMDILYIH